MPRTRYSRSAETGLDEDGLLISRVLHHARDIDAEHFS